MAKYFYKKTKTRNYKIILRILSLVISLIGIYLLFYIFFPLISWRIYFQQVFSYQDITSPIPKNTIVNPSIVKSLIDDAAISIKTDYTKAYNWFPLYKQKSKDQKIESYTLSIPKLNIKNAVVSTVNYDLSKQLINYDGTSVPPDNGNSVIFGHSTLPQLFNQNDYKTIFANLYTLKTGDEFFVNIRDVKYKYKIFSIMVVDPSETSIFSQDFSNSFITLVTCTPPGTTWKRLVLKASFEKI